MNLVPHLPASWWSAALASCIVPFFYNQVWHLLTKAQRKLTKYVWLHERVWVRDNKGIQDNDLFRYVGMYVDHISKHVSGDRCAYLLGKENKERDYSDTVIDTTNNQLINFEIQPHVHVEDVYQGIGMTWELCQYESKLDKGIREYYQLTISMFNGSNVPNIEDLRHNHMRHIAEFSKNLESSQRKRFLRSNSYHSWSETITFDHPFNFDNLALPLRDKELVIKDLNEFVNGKDYYKRVGKPWKRGYLLYGPPGTGKTSLVSAIGNYLGYDIYDLDLTSVNSNMQLRTLLVKSKPKSVILIEDIDCTINLSRQPKSEEKQITLSGMLNFCDGLWSNCADERIFIFTSNHPENLDPALLRKGRMDLHLLLTYCRFEAFKTLAKNYLNLDGHELFSDVQDLIEDVNVTPADVGEILLSSRAEPTAAIHGVIELLKSKKLSTTLELPNFYPKKASKKNKRKRKSRMDEGGNESSKRRLAEKLVVSN